MVKKRKKHKKKKAENHSIYDSKRFQLKDFDSSMKFRWVHELKEKIQNKLDTIGCHLVAQHFTILLSLPNGVNQKPHYDFNTSNYQFPLLSGIVSINDNTKLNIYEGNEQKVNCVRILCGECLLFTGMIKHGGACYNTENRRIFFKVLPKREVLLCEDLINISYDEVSCRGRDNGCQFTACDKKTVRNHERLCICYKGEEGVAK